MEKILIATVLKPQGLSGELKCKLENENYEVVKNITEVYLNDKEVPTKVAPERRIRSVYDHVIFILVYFSAFFFLAAFACQAFIIRFSCHIKNDQYPCQYQKDDQICMFLFHLFLPVLFQWTFFIHITAFVQSTVCL